MSTLVWKNAKFLMDGYELTGFLNAFAVEYKADTKDVTPFGVNTRVRVGGLKDFTISGTGFWDTNGTIDAMIFSNMGVSGKVVTLAPSLLTVGSVAYFAKTVEASYNPGAAVGDVLKYTVTADAQDDLVRGQVAFNAAITVTTNGAAQNLGAVSATQKLFAALHVVAASGSGAAGAIVNESVTVTIQSAPASNFASPTTRATFTAKAGLGSEFVSVSGAITDAYWRAVCTVAGTTPGFTPVVSLGIQ